MDFTTLTPESGSGRDLPKECGADGEHKMFPPPKYVPMPKIIYPYNKCTKYIDESKIEFNTTPDNEYVNIQNGDLSNRITMFRRGNMEIRQLGPTFYHSVNQVKNKKQGSAPGNIDDPKSEINTYRGLHHTFVNDGLIFTESKSSVHTQKNKFKIINQITNFISRAKINFTTKIMEIAVKSLLIDGEVQIRGNLKVFGDVKFSGEIGALNESVSFRLKKLEQEVKEAKTEAAKAKEMAEELQTATKDSLVVGNEFDTLSDAGPLPGPTIFVPGSVFDLPQPGALEDYLQQPKE